MSNELLNYYADDHDIDGFGLAELADYAGRELAEKDAEISRLQEVVTNENGKEWYRFWLMRGETIYINGAAFEAGETDVLISLYAKPQEVTR
jgi:hypothetical protein